MSHNVLVYLTVVVLYASYALPFLDNVRIYVIGSAKGTTVDPVITLLGVRDQKLLQTNLTFSLLPCGLSDVISILLLQRINAFHVKSMTVNIVKIKWQ